MASNFYTLASFPSKSYSYKTFNKESWLKCIGKTIPLLNTWNIQNLKGLGWLASYI